MLYVMIMLQLISYNEINEIQEITTYQLPNLVLDRNGQRIPLLEIEGQFPKAGTDNSTLYQGNMLWETGVSTTPRDLCILESSGKVAIACNLDNPGLEMYSLFGQGDVLWKFDTDEESCFQFCASSETGVVSLVGGCFDDSVYYWSETLDPVPEFQMPGLALTALNPEGDRMVWMQNDLILYCMDTATQEILWTSPYQFEIGFANYVEMEIAQGGTRVLVTGLCNNWVAHNVLDMETGIQIGSTIQSGSGGSLAGISGDGSRVVQGDVDGTVNFWTFNGTDWIKTHNKAIGQYVWRTAISTDGYTVLASTASLEAPYDSKVVCFDWPETGLPTVLWEYDEYADWVCDLDVSSDGQVIAVGCWGAWEYTSGDVFTVFDRSGGIIARMLDDIDAVGSALAVDLTEDGDFSVVTFSNGHQRGSGKGFGAVSTFQVSPLQQHDVGVSQVLKPECCLQLDEIVIPEVIVGNYGSSTEVFDVSALIKDSLGVTIWTDLQSVTGLPAGEVETVLFSSWTVPEAGKWTFCVIANLPGDMCSINDTLTVSMKAGHDGSVVNILLPYDNTPCGIASCVYVTVGNEGTYLETMDVNVNVSGPGGTEYSETIQVDLSPGESYTSELPPWTPEETGYFTVEASVDVESDSWPDNNTLEKPVTVDWEIRYDDGFHNGNLGAPQSAVRFTPMLSPPFSVSQVRVLTCQEGEMWVSLCYDNGSGIPDVDHPIQKIEGVTTLINAWTTVPFDIQVDIIGDIWVVVGNGTDISLDITYPGDFRSYGYDSSWSQIWGDLRIRLTIDPPEGISEDEGQQFAVGLPCPNPASSHISLPVSIPAGGCNVDARVFDLSGRMVDTVCEGRMEAGQQSISWDTNEAQNQIPAGVYILRVQGAGLTMNRKILVVRD